MSLAVQSLSPYDVCRSGIIPYVCEDWEGKPLFIIQGRVTVGLVITIYGKAYKYEDFRWPEGECLSKQQCLQIAKENNKTDSPAWVSDKVYAQFKKILGKT